jgi:hypothetical protein
MAMATAICATLLTSAPVTPMPTSDRCRPKIRRAAIMVSTLEKVPAAENRNT